MTATPTLLAPRRCHLRDSDHKYIWEPTGETMAISVTGVTGFFKEPYSGPPDASWTVEKMGSSVSPYQVLRNSSVMHAVGDAGATLQDQKSGALLSVGSLDAALLSVGAPDPFYATTKDGSPPATATHGSSFCLANNIWGTNYVMWQPYDAKDSDAAFRFTLRAVAAQA